MKKIIAILLSVVLLLSLTACSAPELPSFTTNWGKEDVFEKSTYKITIQEAKPVDPEDSSADKAVKAPRLSGEGTYTSTISGGGSVGYKIETTMNFVGKYTMADGSTVPVDDTVSSYVNFSDLMQDFRPTSSYKNYQGKTVVYANKAYTVEDLNYESTITYGEDDATVKTAQLGATGAYDTQVSTIPLMFNVKLPSGNLYDNEQIFYMLRSFGKVEGTSLPFSVVTGTAQEAIPMSGSINVGSTFEIATDIDGVKNDKTKVKAVLVQKTSGENNGSPIKLFYAINDQGAINNASGSTKNDDRSRLVRIEQLVPYTADRMIFDLVEYQYGETPEPTPTPTPEAE